MFSIFGKTALGAAIAAAAALVATPAEARRYDRGSDDAAIAIGAGVVGLAIGAAIASNNDRRYYRDRYYYYDDGPRYRGYYYNRPNYRNYYRYDRRDYRYRDRDRWDRHDRRNWRGDRGRYYRR